jgi:uncharacterized protein (DUF1501 family)|nr:DUF1501 domain-containing protein [Kofleriaceae bacterium]
MKRRTFMQLGVQLGAAAVGAAVVGRRLGATAALPAPKRLVVVFATGGWDTTYALDPKEPAHADVPPGAVQRFGGLDVFVDPSRPNVAAYFERHAAVTAIVRGISVDAINHAECMKRIATGTREETNPDVAAIVAHDLANDLPVPYLVLGDVAYTGAYAVSAGRIGATNQLAGLVSPQPGDAPTDAEAAVMRAYAQASVDRAHATRGARGYNRARVDDFVASIDRSARLRGLAGVLGQRGTTLGLAAQVPLAIEALAQDLSHAVMVSGAASALAWDTHVDEVAQGPLHDQLFAALTALVDGLASRPGRGAGTTMLDDTVVAVISELGRTPRLNASAGKEHWPVTAAMVIGGGVAGGRVIGATDPDANALAIDLGSGDVMTGGVKPLYSNLTAGLLELCGVDPANHLPQEPLGALVG